MFPNIKNEHEKQLVNLFKMEPNEEKKEDCLCAIPLKNGTVAMSAVNEVNNSLLTLDNFKAQMINM